MLRIAAQPQGSFVSVKLPIEKCPRYVVVGRRLCEQWALPGPSKRNGSRETCAGRMRQKIVHARPVNLRERYQCPQCHPSLRLDMPTGAEEHTDTYR